MSGKMRVLVLGGSGYIGSRLCERLAATGWATPVAASSRHATDAGVRVDTTDMASLVRALDGIDAVVNCVAGNRHAIADGAKALALACIETGCPRIVHLSSMSVYGPREGVVRDGASTDPSLGWYARAKCEAEHSMAAFARAGGTPIVLRPGCVWGPGSQLWVGRIARYLNARRLGDLGAAGDGWSNLVHVDNVCDAIEAALQLPESPGRVRAYNLAAPDSPRWNDYFVDLALTIGATPVRRISQLQLRLDAWLGGPPLKIAQSALAKLGRRAASVPDPLPPNLVGLWERHLRLESPGAERDLAMRWTPYGTGLAQSAQWVLEGANHA
ncbi:MAG: NAD-dependent epimerase/dehydratase family protein [Ramlibacter sp.]